MKGRKRHIVVVGGVAAGTSAAAKAKRIDPGAEVVLLEKGADISYGTCSMPYYIGDIIKAPTDLVLFTRGQFEQEKGVKVKVHHEALGIQPHKKVLIFRDLERERESEMRYDELIVATGSSAGRLNVPGEECGNVFHLKSLEDAVQIKNYLEKHRPKSAVVIGGGFIGMEMAEAFCQRGLSVKIVEAGDRPMPRLEKESSVVILEELKRFNVAFHPGARIKGFERQGDSVCRVLTNRGYFEADIILVALGFRPNTGFAGGTLSLGQNDAIDVDLRQRTSQDHVYAAGSCAVVRDLITNKRIHFPLADVANKTGRVAGENAGGGRAEFQGVVRTTAVKIFDLQVAHTGLGSEEAKSHGFDVVTDVTVSRTRPAYYPGSRKTLVCLVADRQSRRLIGADIVSEHDAAHRINVLAVAITNRMTVDDVSNLDLMYSPPFTTVWDPTLIAANSMVRKLNKA